MSASNIQDRNWPVILAVAFLCTRLIQVLSFNLDGLFGYGDLLNYYLVPGLPGLPFIDYWVEFPPVFPFLANALLGLSGGSEHRFAYLLVFVLTVANTGSVFYFVSLSTRFFPVLPALFRSAVFVLLLVALPYTWWYFDPIAVFFLLWGLKLLLDQKPISGGMVIGLGIATKLLPGVALLAGWQRLPWKRLALLITFAFLPLLLSYTALWLVSPDYTWASMQSQGSKGSWETIWALVDGNFQTGNFGPLADRLDPAAASRLLRNPAVVSPVITLLVFGLLGMAALFSSRIENERHATALVGLAWCLLMLASPGWSPQWVLYILPLILLVLPEKIAYLISTLFALVNLLEWPVLLSRGMFWAIGIPIILRTMLLVLLAWLFYSQIRSGWLELRRQPLRQNTAESE